jgi:predicted MFS family arabinose efflux permease
VRKRFRDLFAPLKFRDFRFLWLAQVFSELGDWAGRLALAVVVAERTHSTTLTALVTTASVLPYLGIGQLFATYINRFPRRNVIVATDIGRAMLFALMATSVPIPVLLVLAFAAGMLTPPFEAARNALTPLSVPTKRYGDAIALASVTFDGAVLFGYAAGGGLIASVGARPALLINAASFLVSALLLNYIPAARQRGSETDHPTVRDAWNAVFDDPFVRRFVTSFTVVGSAAVVAESLVAIYAIEELHSEAGVSGLLAAAIPVGAIAATVIGRSGGDDRAKLRVASAVALVGAIAGIIGFAIGPSLPLVLAPFAAVGALNASRVPANEVAGLRLEDRMRAPANSVINGFLLGSQAVAAAGGGLLAKLIGIRSTIVFALVLAGLVGAWGVLRPPHEIRHRVGVPTTQR